MLRKYIDHKNMSVQRGSAYNLRKNKGYFQASNPDAQITGKTPSDPNEVWIWEGVTPTRAGFVRGLTPARARFGGGGGG